jgi:hypothetical protein
MPRANTKSPVGWGGASQGLATSDASPLNSPGDNNTGAPPTSYPNTGDTSSPTPRDPSTGPYPGDAPYPDVPPPVPGAPPDPAPQTATIRDRANQPNTVPATPKPADLGRYGQAQTGSFPNSFVNLQAYLNANPTPPSFNQQQAPGQYTQGQSNLDQTMRGAYYGPQFQGQSGLPMWGAPGFAATPNAAAQGSQAQGPQAATPSAGSALSSGGPTGASPQPGIASPMGATPQPGNANPTGALTGGQNQSVQNMAPGTTYGSQTEKDRPFPRLQKYLG